MNIGKKIKELRAKKIMTQAELAGDMITRNMLSSIENGTALPSVTTLRYIAAKLNVPAGYLLADGDDEKLYVKMSEITNIKNAFISKNYRICVDMCVNTEIERDDEINLIYAESLVELAKEYFKEGMLRSAALCFDEAIEVCEDTIYNTDHIRAISGVYFKYMRHISATLSSDIIDEVDLDNFGLAYNDFSKYVMAFEAICNGNSELARYFIRGFSSELPYALHINARLDMQNAMFDEAYSKLYLILTDPHKIQEPLMYFVFCDLEVCCRERKDFKGAYEYTNNKLDILQKMLSDN